MKKKAKVPKPAHSYRMTIVSEFETRPFWWGSFTWYLDGDPQVTITAASDILFELQRVLEHAMWQAQQGLGQGQLMLPDMGDFQVTYHTKN